MTKSITLILAAMLIAGLALNAQANPRGSCCPPPPPPQTVVLEVCHPCTECKFEVPVCIPACCQGTPSVCFQRTLIGSGKTVFEWSNGYRVVVRYTNGGGYRVVQ